jgi:hypothetical protein
MPDDRLHIVDDRDMPDVCLQHLLAIHAAGRNGRLCRRARPGAHAVILRQLPCGSRMKASPARQLTDATPPRQAIIEVTTTDGRRLRHHTRAVLGTPPTR